MVNRFLVAVFLLLGPSFGAQAQTFSYDHAKFWKTLSQDDFSKGDIILMERFNRDRAEVIEKVRQIAQQPNDQVVVEFRRIQHWKYRVVVHNAHEPFGLIFSDTFNTEWHLFPVQASQTDLNRSQLRHYAAIRGTARQQASLEELEAMINKGLISTLGTGELRYHKAYEHLHQNKQRFPNSPIPYRIDFISKMQAQAIQNENLSSGSRFDYYFMSPIANEQTQFVANGFANGWVIEPEAIEREFPGAWDKEQGKLEFLLVYRPQWYLDMGAAISLTVLFITSLVVITKKPWQAAS